MKKLILQCITVLLSFLAGIGFMSYATYMGNRDMTTVMAGATLPVVYAQKNGRLYNELHGYVEAMDGCYMKDSVLGISEDHTLMLAVEKYNVHIQRIAYEVRSLDMSRLVEDGENLQTEDDGRYLHLELNFKDLMEKGEIYLLILKVEADEHDEILFYSQISYLGENYVKECVDFAESFHEMTLNKDQDLYRYLEVDGSMDGKNLGYVNIHSNSGPVTWGDVPMEQVSDTMLHFTDFNGDKVSLVMEYQLENTQTDETYQVTEAFCVQYSSSRMYLLAYDRRADRIFTGSGPLVEDGRFRFGIQSQEVNYEKNNEENVIGFVQQGQLWCYDFGQNRLSLVYGFEDGEDRRGTYGAHDFRILKVEDSGSMNFLVYGYMNRGRYEGMSGILLCYYDALLNTVEEQFFLPSTHPYQVLKEEIGSLTVVNEKGTAWMSYRGMIFQINPADLSVRILAEGVHEDQLRVSEDGLLAAWTDADEDNISLLNTKSGRVDTITSESGEVLQVLGFMEDDLIYGTADQSDVWTGQAGNRVILLNKVIIRDTYGNEIREFDYASKGKYVVGFSAVENRIDLSCVTLSENGSLAEALSEPITYTSEPTEEKLRLETASDEIKRNEYHLAYEGTLRSSSMKQPRVKLVLFEDNRTLQIDSGGTQGYLAWTFTGEVKAYDTLAEAVIHAYDGEGSDDGMGAVWRDGIQRFWQRWKRTSRTPLEGFEEEEVSAEPGNSVAECLQMMLRQLQIYTDVQADLAAGMAAWEICERELSQNCCLLPGCSLRMVLYYVDQGAPVMGIKDTGEAVLIVGYDSQNITYYEPGQTALKKAGMNDSSEMFKEAGNLFITYLP